MRYHDLFFFREIIVKHSPILVSLPCFLCFSGFIFLLPKNSYYYFNAVMPARLSYIHKLSLFYLHFQNLFSLGVNFNIFSIFFGNLKSFCRILGFSIVSEKSINHPFVLLLFGLASFSSVLFFKPIY